MKQPARYYINSLKLLAHPEGGYYRETYRSEQSLLQAGLPSAYDGDRSISTAIYYLLEEDQVSRFHRMKSDEIFHFYAGDPLIVHSIDQAGNHREQILGLDIDCGHAPQAYISGGDWFGAEVIQGGNYSLVGCTVAPGFEFADFEIGEREALLTKFPKHRGVIERLTPEV